MRKLLSADFSRLWKDKIFWLCMGAMLIYSVLYMLNGCRQATIDLTEYNYSIDKYYFHFAISIGIFCSLFSSMFFGTEYSDGTIRNKVVVGHTKTNIYLASLITTITATLLMMLVWLVGALVAIPTLGVWEMGIPNLFVYLLIAIMFVMALSAICTLVNMVSANKAVTVAISIFLILGLLVFSSMIYNALSEPEMTSGVLITANGMEAAEPAPNPNFVSGIMRTVYEFIVDFLPTGQGLKMSQLEVSRPVLMIVSSVTITFLTTFGGIVVFKKKDLR
ncbi:ABC transporter permease [Blautia schinkii]|nr:ABC transporter permease [Blautia schinkii]